jgi:peroxiredoxin
MVFGGSGGNDQAAEGTQATEFTLPTSLGTEVALDDVLANGDALLYFSMGVGCDGCFAQIPEIEAPLADMGITLMPVMVQSADQVRGVAERFGINTPILIDENRSVSKEYDMLGVYGHSDRPSHSFALVGRDGTVKWVKHYATMFVPVDDFMADMAAA